MKATYMKPLLTMEMFSLTQSTARDCAETLELNLSDIVSCAWDMGNGMTVFTSQPTCQLIGQPDDFGCYNNPSEGNYIFRS